MFTFPKATEELLSAIQEHRDNPAPIIDMFLKQFSIGCAQAFMTSLTRTSGLFNDDELLERMKEHQS
jgi:hypothetical protein